MFKSEKKLLKSKNDDVILPICGEIFDRAAVLEALVRSARNPLLLDDAPLLALPKEDRYLRERAKLKSLRHDLLLAELRLDASLTQLGAIFASDPKALSCFDDYFVRVLDKGISDHSDSHNPDSSEATQMFSKNYLIDEGKFPFGDLFNEEDVKRMFGKLRGEVWAIINGLFC